jgi:hypothetical protein
LNDRQSFSQKCQNESDYDDVGSTHGFYEG